VRVYVAGALAQELPHPGTPWNVQRLPNGDLVTCCNQSGVCPMADTCALLYLPDSCRPMLASLSTAQSQAA
jgi:hypothetical protein